MRNICPSPDQLLRLLADELGEARESPIVDHVEDCARCQDSLERLTEAGLAAAPVRTLAPSSDREDAEFLESLKAEPPSSLLPGDRDQGGLDLTRDSSDRPSPEGYEILSELGRGGMAVVYMARQCRLNRLVALKMLLPGGCPGARELDRFRREAETIAGLKHPHIVQIHEVGEYDGRPFLALEFVDGESLARRIDGAPQGSTRGAELVSLLARAIHSAHEVGVVHRDLKPANVLLTVAGEPKIADFGLAKRQWGEQEFPTLAEQFLGTPSYMAPERVARDREGSARTTADSSPAVDVFSLGAILYEMLTGRPPFRAETPLETVLQVIHQEPVPPSRLRSNVPRDLETICLKCLEKNATRRYPRALDLALDLERFLRFEPVKARPASALERLARWARRNPSLAFTAGLAAVLVAATIGLSASLAVHEYRAASRLGEALALVQSRGRQVDQQAAHLAYEHGQALCEQGEVAQGMLWLVRGLKSATLARDADLARAFRLNLSAWTPRLHPLRARCDHPAAIQSAAYSPDGRLIAMAGDSGVVQIHAAATGRPIGPSLVHPNKICTLAFSPDGRTLISGCDDKLARFWDVATGRPKGPILRHDGSVLGVAYSPDGRLVATGSFDQTVRLWNASTGELVGRPMHHDNLVSALAYSPDGRTILSGSWDKTARLWDATTGEPVGAPLVHRDWVSAVAYSPDGRTVLTGCYDRTARLWDRATGRQIGRPLWHQHCVRSVAMSPDGRMVLTGSIDGVARLWDVALERPIGPPLRHQHTVSAVAFSPDGRFMLTAGFDKTALIRGLAPSRERTFAHRGFIRSVLFSPDGKTILTASVDHTARLWNVASGAPIGTALAHEGAVEAIAYAPDGLSVLTGSMDGTARLWSALDGRPLSPPMRHGNAVKAVAFSPRGDSVLTGSGDATARLWNATGGAPMGAPLRHGDWVQAVAYSPNGRLIATGGDDKTARLWNAATGAPLGPPLEHGGRVLALAFSSDGRTVLTGCDDMKARLWDAASGTLRIPPLPHDGPVSIAAFSPDGLTVVSGGWDRVARLWDARTGAAISPPLRHEGALRALALSRDGRTLVTGSYDRTAQLWDKATGKPIGSAFHHENQVWFVAISPDGRTVLSGGQENKAHLWDVASSLDAPFDDIDRQVRADTGMELRDDGTIHFLDLETWNRFGG